MRKTFENVKDEIITSSCKAANFVIGFSAESTEPDITYGTYVVTGLTQEGTQVIGYIVQVRQGWGAFGSDAYFIRDHTGKLTVHENQCYWRLSPEQIEALRPFFKHNQYDELLSNPEIEYSQGNGKRLKGFLILKDEAPTRTDSTSFAITMSQVKP